MAVDTKQKKKKKENRFSFLYILGGGILKEDFIVKHTKMIVLVVMLIFIFIGNRYVCMQRYVRSIVCNNNCAMYDSRRCPFLRN